ncbi:MAG: iron ABC transporter permease, partial [Clostridia bacterium]|nr:iron ABC transporter permease [Clostridia bacterium]
RIIAAALIGCALSTAGGIYQGMFKNPMVSPDILGSSAGAGFGAALGILCSFGYYGISFSAFVFGLIAVVLAVLAASKFRSNVALGLVLAGIMTGSLFQACTSFIKLVADPTDELPAITYWLMGSLASIRLPDLKMLLPVMLVGLIPLFFLRWRLNVITLSEEEARSLGVNTKRIRVLVILCATLVTAASVAVSGMIGWVGLVIPHFARKMVGCDYKVLLPATMLIGGSFLMVVDNVARTLTTSEVPIGILTAFIGAPFFLYLILQGGKKRL